MRIFLLSGSSTPQEPPTITYRQLRERGFKGTKYDAELMIAQGFTLAATAEDNIAPFLGRSCKIDFLTLSFNLIVKDLVIGIEFILSNFYL